MEFLMPTYIANLHAEWAAKWTELGRPWSDKVPEVPMPANTILSVAGTEKHPRPSDAEITETMALHMKLTGQLLWLARMCFPDLLFSCSQLPHVLSASGWTALEFRRRFGRESEAATGCTGANTVMSMSAQGCRGWQSRQQRMPPAVRRGLHMRGVRVAAGC